MIIYILFALKDSRTYIVEPGRHAYVVYQSQVYLSALLVELLAHESVACGKMTVSLWIHRWQFH